MNRVFGRAHLIPWLTAVCACVSVASLVTAAQPGTVNPRAAQLKAFTDRVTEYVALHKKVDGEVPSLKRTDDPAEIAAREKLLGDAIRAARKDAKPGDLFIPAVAEQFRRAIRADVRRRGPKAARAMMTEVPTDFQPRINGTYPATKALATVPPLLIASLQPLPEEVEYRFFGHALILRDVKANIIVDFVPNAIPAVN
jgi:hypothetical protein